jgi:protein transport protein SEC61 subunit gamma and related proteins
MKMAIKLSSFFGQCKRVWHILKKPSLDEFKVISKVSAIGILIIGAVGFLVSGIMTYVNRFVG